MIISIDKHGAKGEVNINEKVTGKGSVNFYSWCVTSTSSAIILEIADDPTITPDDLPLVGYGCAGWLFEKSISFNKADKNTDIQNAISEGFLLFSENKLKFMPAVTCSCSDL